MRYPGGKNAPGTYQKLICQIPPHETYIEGFLGSGAVLRHKRPARYSIAIDADAEVVRSFGRPPTFSAVRSRTLKIYCRDAVAFLSSYQWRGGEMVYLDPPYVRSTRRSGARIYRKEMTDDQHRELLRVVKRIPRSVYVMVSGYYSEMYARALRNWRVMTFEVALRGGERATEYVWMNYAEPVALHDYRYVGENYRERERISKKKRRWVAKLERMDTHERYAVLSAIKDLWPDGNL